QSRPRPRLALCPSPTRRSSDLPTRHIFARDVYRYCYVGRRNIYNRTTIINNTYIVNNRHYYGGPSRRDMERTTGRRVSVHNVRQDRKSTRVNSSHVKISYAVFC